MKKLIIPIIALAFMASCTDDVIQSDFSEKGLVVKPKISVTFDSLLCDQSDATRASINITGNGKMFSTVLSSDNDDMYGITNAEGTINIPASVSGKGENQTLDLDIEGDGLSVGEKYILYYPYNDSFLKRTTYNDCYVGAQSQFGSDRSYVANSANFLYSDPVELSENGFLNFKLHSVNAIVRIKVSLQPDNYSSIELVNTDGLKVFSTCCRYAYEGDSVKVGKCPDYNKSSRIVLNLEHVSFTGTKNKNKTFDLAVLPCKTGYFKIKATNKNGEVYESESIKPKEFKAGYGYIINPKKMKQTSNSYNDENRLNGIEYVDLGLSVCWAKYNVGAISADDCGSPYSWAENISLGDYLVDGYAGVNNNYINELYSNSVVNYRTKTAFNWEQYKWNNKGFVSKYHISDAVSKPYLKEEDDVAKLCFGKGWRTPTESDFQELLDNCHWEYTSNYGDSEIGGYIVYKAKNDRDKGLGGLVNEVHKPDLASTYSNSDPHIFLPYTNICEASGTSQSNEKVAGYYMTQNACVGYTNILRNIYFRCFVLNRKDEYGLPIRLNSFMVYHGSYVRPVCNKPKK